MVWVARVFSWKFFCLEEYLLYLCLILFVTLISGEFCKRLKMSVVIGELLAGIFLSFIITDNTLISIFSEMGFVLLMFLAGLESNLKFLKRTIKSSFIIAVFGIVIPILIAFVTGVLFGFTNKQSIFIGIIFAATSVSISVKVLREMQVLNSIEGTAIVGAAIVDDILSVFLLSYH